MLQFFKLKLASYRQETTPRPRFAATTPSPEAAAPTFPLPLFTPTIWVINRNDSGYGQRLVDDSELKMIAEDKANYHWVKVNGIHDPELVRRVGKAFSLHPLMVEDVLEAGTRPKVEVYEQQVFMILRLLSYDQEAMRVVSQQVSIIADESTLLTFQELQSGSWENIEKRVLQRMKRLREFGFDHLLFALLDVVQDEYFIAVGRLAEDIEEIESQVLADNREQILTRVYRLKREVLFMHRSLWPLREAIGRLSREFITADDQELRFLTTNLQQDMLQVVEAVDTLREMLSGILNLYMGRRDLRLNEVGQVLTVVATIFIPLTFITGFYGMNFETMPMLHWPYGYPVVVGVMLLVAGWLAWVFKRKRWFSARSMENPEDEGAPSSADRKP